MPEQQQPQASQPLSRLSLKICGMREPDNIRQAATLQPDFLGFIFYRGSKRYAGDLDKQVLNELPSSIKKTGVFVNAEANEIIGKIGEYRLDAVQLHGSESPEICGCIQAEGVGVIKAFGINERFDFGILEEYAAVTDFFLFDTNSAQYGGTGSTFNWDLLKKNETEKPFFLSGGLGPENIAAISSISHPFLYALDFNSRFETEPGLKDISKLKTTFQQIKNYSANTDQKKL